MTKPHKLKTTRRKGGCSVTELKAELQRRLDKRKLASQPLFTVEALIELYLALCIEDRKSNDGKIISSACKREG